jgi:pimeloyl-ACP methyl ester carboxylesterase
VCDLARPFGRRTIAHIGTLERVERLIIVAGAPSARVLENVRCPVLVVLGALDELAVPARPRVQIEVIAGVGHDPHLDPPTGCEH